MMEPSACMLLHLLGCSARGAEPQLPATGVNWAEVYSLALEQRCATVIFPAVQQLYEKGALTDVSDLYAKWKSMVINEVSSSISRMNGVASVMRKLSDESIPFIILKGSSISELYQFSDYRISRDTDILIPAEAENRALKCLADMGGNVEMRVKGHLHSRCNFKTAGLVELHTTLVDDILSDICFEGYGKTKFEDFRTRRCFGAFNESYMALDGEDEFIFITTHFIKHLVTAGASLLQISDILLLVRARLHTMDWNSVAKHCSEIKVDKAVSAILRLGALFYGYPQYELPGFPQCSDETALELLAFIIKDRMRKTEETEERHMMFIRSRYERNGKGGYFRYIAKWRIPRVWQRFFPGGDRLRIEYSYAREGFLKLTMAFFHNIGINLRNFFKKRSVSSLFQVGKKSGGYEDSEDQMKLYKNLNML